MIIQFVRVLARKKLVMEWGGIYLPFFRFMLTPIFFICCFLLLLVMIQNSPMLINNMFFHICDAMCKVVRKNTFFGLCHVVVIIGNLSHMGWHKMHFMFWTSCIWTCVAGSYNTKNAQGREMQLWGLQNVMFICSSTNITSHASC